MKDVLVIGSSGHAKVVIEIIEMQSKYQIAGIIDSSKEKGDFFCGYPILGKVKDLTTIGGNIGQGIVAIGDNWTRFKEAERILEQLPTFEFVTAVHPSSEVSKKVKLGKGSVVMPGVIINSGSRVGEHTILNTRSSIDHDNRFGDFVSLAPGTTTGGNVQIGTFSAIGLGASIIHRITIGEHTVVGAGSTVTRDIPSFVVAYGTPAKETRQRKRGEPYL